MAFKIKGNSARDKIAKLEAELFAINQPIRGPYGFYYDSWNVYNLSRTEYIHIKIEKLRQQL